jgi:hypothetical protein
MKRITMILRAAVLAGCGATSAANADTIKYKSDAQWNVCAEKVGKKNEGKDLGNMGLNWIIRKECGYEPEPTPEEFKKLSEFVLQFCDESTESGVLTTTGAAVQAYWMYNEKGKTIRKLTSQCTAKTEAAKKKWAAEAPDREAQQERLAAIKERITLRIGLPEADVYTKFGFPSDTNTNVGIWGTHKQLIYGNSLIIYTENGRVSSWQTH